MYALPETGFLRLAQIIGDPKATPPIPALIPVSAATFWRGVKSERYPKPVHLSERVTAWRVEEIRAFIDSQRPAESEPVKVAPRKRRTRTKRT